MTKAEYNAKYAEIADDFLKYSETVFGRVSTPNALADAMKYSFFAGGKRIRPVLTLAFGDALGLDKKVVMPFAFGLECIHTYSLIHDDLPSMDNDSLRRGKPTCHVKYGEATALLAGDALLNFAFEHILGVVSTKNEINALKCLADCSGYSGMVSGQVSDKESENATDKNENKLFETYELKTGKLLTAPFAMTLNYVLSLIYEACEPSYCNWIRVFPCFCPYEVDTRETFLSDYFIQEFCTAFLGLS